MRNIFKTTHFLRNQVIQMSYNYNLKSQKRLVEFLRYVISNNQLYSSMSQVERNIYKIWQHCSILHIWYNIIIIIIKTKKTITEFNTITYRLVGKKDIKSQKICNICFYLNSELFVLIWTTITSLKQKFCCSHYIKDVNNRSNF